MVKTYIGRRRLWLMYFLIVVICIVFAAVIGGCVRTYQDLLVNLLADFMFVGIGTVLAWVYYKRRSEGLLKFFGVDASRKTLTIYVSSIECEPDHAIGIDGQRTTCGSPAAPFRELNAANRFRELFAYPFPSLFNSAPMDQPQISDVQVEIRPSLLKEQTAFAPLFPFISIGGPAFNAAPKFIENLNSKMRSVSNGDRTTIRIGDESYEELDYGFIERIVRPQEHIFYVAGPSSIGSAGAAYFLATQWKKLSKECDDDTDLLVRLRFDPNDFMRCLEVRFLMGDHWSIGR